MQEKLPAQCLLGLEGQPPLGLHPAAAGLAGKGAARASQWNPALHPQGCCTSLPGPDSAALGGGGGWGQGLRMASRAQPLQEGPALPPQGSEPRWVAPLLGLLLALHACACTRACAQLPCLPFVGQGGEPGDVVRGRGRHNLAILEHFTLLRACELGGSSGQSGRGGRVGCYGHHYCHPHLHFIDDK